MDAKNVSTVCSDITLPSESFWPLAQKDKVQTLVSARTWGVFFQKISIAFSWIEMTGKDRKWPLKTDDNGQ